MTPWHRKALAGLAEVAWKTRNASQSGKAIRAQSKAMKSCGAELGGKCQIEVRTCSTL